MNLEYVIISICIFISFNVICFVIGGKLGEIEKRLIDIEKKLSMKDKD